jgi:hypothetical protein
LPLALRRAFFARGLVNASAMSGVTRCRMLVGALVRHMPHTYLRYICDMACWSIAGYTHITRYVHVHVFIQPPHGHRPATTWPCTPQATMSDTSGIYVAHVREIRRVWKHVFRAPRISRSRAT